MDIQTIMTAIVVPCLAGVSAVLTIVVKCLQAAGKDAKKAQRWQDIVNEIMNYCVTVEALETNGTKKKRMVLDMLPTGLTAEEKVKAGEFIDKFIEKTKKINFTEKTGEEVKG